MIMPLGALADFTWAGSVLCRICQQGRRNSFEALAHNLNKISLHLLRGCPKKGMKVWTYVQTLATR